MSLDASRRAALALVLLAAGCGGGDGRPAAVDPFDADRARSALTAALDAWKRGQARELNRRTPPIRFSDDDLAAGWRLDDYALVEPDQTLAAYRDVPVILSLRNGRGEMVRRETSYQVVTSPSLAVLRSDR